MQNEVHLAYSKPAYRPWNAAAGESFDRALSAIWQSMGRDPENPFGGWLSPGGTAVLKPNWVMDFNPQGSLDSLITHPSLIHAALGWCAIALGGEGRVVVGDSPLQGCDFRRLVAESNLAAIVADVQGMWPKLSIEVQDWRLTTLDRVHVGKLSYYGRQTQRDSASTVDKRYVLVDMGRESFLEELADYADRFRVTMYKPSLMLKHHRPGVHEYIMRREPLEADLLVNLPKLKTHEKAGLTGALKNLVGLNGHKEFLPHHTRGAYFEGGDAYCRANRFRRWSDDLYDCWWERRSELGPWQRWWYQKVYSALLAMGRLFGSDDVPMGSWSGNETVWRMTLDLNHVAYFGSLRPKRVINLVDGIIAGEGEGPLAPMDKPAGVLLAGENPAYVDAAVARLVGYSLARVPTVYHALNHRRSRFAGPLAEEATVRVLRGDAAPEDCPLMELPSLDFQPPRNWRRASLRYAKSASAPSRTIPSVKQP